MSGEAKCWEALTTVASTPRVEDKVDLPEDEAEFLQLARAWARVGWISKPPISPAEEAWIAHDRLDEANREAEAVLSGMKRTAYETAEGITNERTDTDGH